LLGHGRRDPDEGQLSPPKVERRGWRHRGGEDQAGEVLKAEEAGPHWKIEKLSKMSIGVGIQNSNLIRVV